MFKPRRYHHMIYIGKTKLTIERGLLLYSVFFFLFSRNLPDGTELCSIHLISISCLLTLKSHHLKATRRINNRVLNSIIVFIFAKLLPSWNAV